ncbi:hypothetical protein Fmac_004204 [Flemingia macrophylla]|uniref:Uncharacterized protein n=1 Tax=Flemingia macrophylla TaxID=520843 RepID=A0ABD1N487_9FABA
MFTKSMELSLQRTSSIEREPRTLSISQIQSARGLQPVVSAACCMKSATTMEMDLGEEEELNSRDATTQVAPAAAFRDIASAPF